MEACINQSILVHMFICIYQSIDRSISVAIYLSIYLSTNIIIIIIIIIIMIIIIIIIIIIFSRAALRVHPVPFRKQLFTLSFSAYFSAFLFQCARARIHALHATVV